MGERDQYCSAGVWAGPRNVEKGTGPRGLDYVVGRVSIKLNSPGKNTGNGGCTEAFSSKHPGGAMFLYADASVHFVPEFIEFNNAGITRFGKPTQNLDERLLGAYQKLGIRNDGQSVELP